MATAYTMQNMLLECLGWSLTLQNCNFPLLGENVYMEDICFAFQLSLP